MLSLETPWKNQNVYENYKRLGLDKPRRQHWNKCHWDFKFGSAVPVWAYPKAINGYAGSFTHGHGAWSPPETFGGVALHKEVCKHASAGKYGWTLAQGMTPTAYEFAVGAKFLTQRGFRKLNTHNPHNWQSLIHWHDGQRDKKHFTSNVKDHSKHTIKVCKIQFQKKYKAASRVTSLTNVAWKGKLYKLKWMVECGAKSKVTACELFPPSYNPKLGNKSIRSACRVERRCSGVKNLRLPYAGGRGGMNCMGPLAEWRGPGKSYRQKTQKSLKAWFDLMGRKMAPKGKSKCLRRCKNNCGCSKHPMCLQNFKVGPGEAGWDKVSNTIKNLAQQACEADCVAI